MQTHLDKFGRITLPKSMRLHLGINTESTLEIKEQNDKIIIKIVSKAPSVVMEHGILVYTGKGIGDFQQALDDIRNERLKDF